MSISHRFVLLLFILWGAMAVAGAGEPAPSCPLPLLGGGPTVDPAALEGKVVYLDFWASWCGPCASSFPFMNQLHKDLQGRGLEIIAVDLDEESEEAQDFLAQHPAAFTVLADPEGNCPRRYDVKAMPTTYLIDRHGKIRDVHLGFREGDKAAVRNKVEALLNER